MLLLLLPLLLLPPLLCACSHSVRSGAAMSMPGMMDTVLNVGLNDVVVEGLAKQVNDRFAWDCYRRLLQVRGRACLGAWAEQEGQHMQCWGGYVQDVCVACSAADMLLSLLMCEILTCIDVW